MPFTAAVVVHKVVLPGPTIVTSEPGVAVPETVGLLVRIAPGGPAIITVGAFVAVRLNGTLLVPPGPEAVTVTGVTPVETVTGQLKVPDTEAVVVHRVVLPGPVITMTLPGVAVPVIGCVVDPAGG